MKEKSFEYLEKRIEELERTNSELKNKKQELHEEVNRFCELVDASKDAIVVINNHGEITTFNRAAEKMFLRKKDTVIGGSLDILVPEEYKPDHSRNVAGFFSVGKPNSAIDKTIELPAVRSDGSRFPIELSLSVGQYSDKKIVIAIIRDITERRKIENEKEELIIKLQNALDEITTLRGILPICSSCKKVRDDDGYWNQIETYITDHSDAEFTHGICPDCIKKLYPDIYDQINRNRENLK